MSFSILSNCGLVVIMFALLSCPYADATLRARRQLPGTACPDSNTGVCRNCVCSPQTARFTRQGQAVGQVIPGSDSTCDRCCFSEPVPAPLCPVIANTNQPRQALMASTPAFSLQGITSSPYYVGCCPFTPCADGYACMFDTANSVYLCCSNQGSGPSTFPTFPTFPTQPTFPTFPPTGGSDPYGCQNGAALIYRLPSGVTVQPMLPVVGCLDLGPQRCPVGTNCQPHNNPRWLKGICCVPFGVQQSTIPIQI